MNEGNEKQETNDNLREDTMARPQITGTPAFLCAAILALTLTSSLVAAQSVNVTTWHNDIGRTGQNTNETMLTTFNVKPATFVHAVERVDIVPLRHYLDDRVLLSPYVYTMSSTRSDAEDEHSKSAVGRHRHICAFLTASTRSTGRVCQAGATALSSEDYRSARCR